MGMTAVGLDANCDPVDTTVRLITPERITFLYPVAGPFRRAGAYLIDLCLLSLLVVAASILTSILALGSGAGVGLLLVIIFVLRFGYGALCEAFFNGQTPGKRALGLRVVSVDGVPITGAQAFLRNLLWPFDGFYPFGYLPALISMILTRRFQRLGDLAAGTMVIVEHRPSDVGLITLREAEVDALLPRLPGRIEAGPELSRALADYVKHRRRFSEGRREEMASPLAEPVRRMYGLPSEAGSDAVLCAMYKRVFLGA